ncbi:MAG: hypothetical protein L6R39_005814, partial [Caloplaca ligustica]
MSRSVVPSDYLHVPTSTAPQAPRISPTVFSATGPAITLGLPARPSSAAPDQIRPVEDPGMLDDDGYPLYHAPEMDKLPAAPEGTGELVREQLKNPYPASLTACRDPLNLHSPAEFLYELDRHTAHPHEFPDEILYGHEPLPFESPPPMPRAPPPTPAMVLAPVP